MRTTSVVLLAALALLCCVVAVAAEPSAKFGELRNRLAARAEDPRPYLQDRTPTRAPAPRAPAPRTPAPRTPAPRSGATPAPAASSGSTRALGGSGTPTPAPPAEIRRVIVAAAQRVGVDVNTMLAMARQESNFRAAARAGTSSAQGLFQFTSGTWAQYVRQYGAQYGFGINDRGNAAKNSIAGALLTRDNARTIGSTAAGDLYLAHFLGAGGCRTMLRASGSAIAANVSGMAAAARANRNVFYHSGGRGKTVNEIKAWANALMARPLAGN